MKKPPEGGLDKNTILRLMVQAGEQCDRFLTRVVDNLPFQNLQVDEQWGYIGMKEKTAFAKGAGSEVGDAYIFTAIDRESKFVACFHVGKRDSDNTWAFIEKLYCCVTGRPQIATDGYGPYSKAIPLTWRYECDFAQLIKQYGSPDVEDQRRYSPAAIVGIDKKAVSGQPDESQISTSHI